MPNSTSVWARVRSLAVRTRPAVLAPVRKGKEPVSAAARELRMTRSVEWVTAMAGVVSLAARGETSSRTRLEEFSMEIGLPEVAARRTWWSSTSVAWSTMKPILPVVLMSVKRSSSMAFSGRPTIVAIWAAFLIVMLAEAKFLKTGMVLPKGALARGGSGC